MLGWIQWICDFRRKRHNLKVSNHKTMAKFTRLSPNPTTKNPTVRPLEILRSPLQIDAWKLKLMKRVWSWWILLLYHLLEHLNNHFFKMDGNGYFPIISCLYCNDLEWSNWKLAFRKGWNLGFPGWSSKNNQNPGVVLSIFSSWPGANWRLGFL